MSPYLARLVLTVAVALAVSQAKPRLAQLDAHAQEELWSHWKQRHNKNYATESEEATKRDQWTANVVEIMQHNVRHDLGLVSYSMGLNQFSDLSWAEFRQRHLSGLIDRSAGAANGSTTRRILFDPSTVPKPYDSVDWRQWGLVRQVKNQGACGSCWAFSTTGAIEGQYAKKFGKPLEFSEQQLVDCSGSFGNHGCNGGLMLLAYNYLERYGLETEYVYPYHARVEPCHFNPSVAVTSVQSYATVRPGDEQALKSLVSNNGPVAIGVDADRGFQHYRSGIYQSAQCSPRALNHAVLVVGYGVEVSQPYWIVKNSWSAQWGEAGYIRLARDHHNMCGVATYASVPNLR